MAKELDKLVGDSGFKLLSSTGSPHTGEWYGFIVNEDAVINSLKDKDAGAIDLTATGNNIAAANLSSMLPVLADEQREGHFTEIGVASGTVLALNNPQ